MAFLRLGYIKEATKGHIASGLLRCIDYILNPKKTEDKYKASFNLNLRDTTLSADAAFHRMLETKQAWGKTDKRQGYHFKLSFPSGDEISPELAMQITKELIESCFSEYEVVYSVHTNTPYLHSHIVFNSVGKFDGRKYHYSKGEWVKYLQPEVNRICKSYGLQTLTLWVSEETKIFSKNHNYGKWKRENPDASNKSKDFLYTDREIRRDVDACIKQAASYEEFVKLLEALGYTYHDNPRRKFVTVLAPGRERVRRLTSLTPDKQTYTRENIKKMIAGTYEPENFWNKELVRKQLLADFQKYQKGFRSKDGISAKIYDVAAYEKSKGFQSVAEIKKYQDYLYQADGLMKEYQLRIQKSLASRSEAMDKLRVILSFYPGYQAYKQGKQEYRESYDRAVAAYQELKKQGYNLPLLYAFNRQALKCLDMMTGFRKHIYIEKKMCGKLKEKYKSIQPAATPADRRQ